MMIAFAPAEIRLRMSALCSAGPPLRFATTTLLTTPLATAWALTAQIISSRQPLPTSVFETPRTYVAFGFAEAVTAAVIDTAASANTVSVQRTPIGQNFIHPPPEESMDSTGGRASLRDAPPFAYLDFRSAPRSAPATRRACSA